MQQDRFKSPLVVVWNPSGLGRAAVGLQAEANRQLQPLFNGVHWYSVVRGEDTTGRAVEDALGCGARTMLVAGGDGTLNRLARHLWEKNALDRMSVGLFPMGTCNDIARTLGWKYGSRVRAAVAELPKLFGGAESHRDLWTLNGELFVNNAGAGRPKRKDSGRSRRLWDFLRMKPIPIHARWDQNEWEGRAYLVVATNGPFFSGGLHFRPDVQAEDGLLDIFLLQAFSKFRLLKTFWDGRRGQPLNVPMPWAFQIKTASLRIESEADLWPQVDGEPQQNEPTRTLVFERVPQKLTLLKYP